jgi:hypothetical protein
VEGRDMAAHHLPADSDAAVEKGNPNPLYIYGSSHFHVGNFIYYPDII